MKNLGKFTLYTPENPPREGTNYLRNEQGVDWYSISWDHERMEKNAYACTDDSNTVVATTLDGELLFPGGLTVWEMLKTEVPEGFLSPGFYTLIVNGAWGVNYSKQASLINEAKDYTEDWRAELALDMISDEDLAKLRKWTAYIKELKNLDLSGAPNINWPEQPEK
jgi:hypothetical protein